jgi:hypothetical protein
MTSSSAVTAIGTTFGVQFISIKMHCTTTTRAGATTNTYEINKILLSHRGLGKNI